MHQAKDDLTLAQVQAQISYDPETGRITRVNHSEAQDEYFTPSGYSKCELAEGMYQSHRLAWLLFYGSWPDGVVDHINGIPYDNRIVNLRAIPRCHNMQNQTRPHKNSQSGLLGVSWDKKRLRWRAQITTTIDGKKRTTNIGRFKDKEAAHAAYIAKKREMHPGCTL